jgi:hypothetical protein
VDPEHRAAAHTRARFHPTERSARTPAVYASRCYLTRVAQPSHSAVTSAARVDTSCTHPKATCSLFTSLRSHNVRHSRATRARHWTRDTGRETLDARHWTRDTGFDTIQGSESVRWNAQAPHHPPALADASLPVVKPCSLLAPPVPKPLSSAASKSRPLRLPCYVARGC